MLNTPVLFLIFNRPVTTSQVFAQIRKAKPAKLFVVADGPRPNNAEDKAKCRETRRIVTNGVDWKCEVKTLFREENRGCGHGPAEAIDWFFNQVEEGIVLEDDVWPSESFFPFCAELLERYRKDNRVRCITGTNFLAPSYPGEFSYLFSEFAGCWGWASWRRAWKGFDYSIASWKSAEMQTFFKDKFTERQCTFFKQIFNSVCNKECDIWDYQWWYHRLVNSGIDIIATRNLVKNIGFEPDATHTVIVRDDIRNMAPTETEFPLRHPEDIMIDHSYDKELSRKFYSVEVHKKRRLFARVVNRIKSISNFLPS